MIAVDTGFTTAETIDSGKGKLKNYRGLIAAMNETRY